MAYDCLTAYNLTVFFKYFAGMCLGNGEKITAVDSKWKNHFQSRIGSRKLAPLHFDQQSLPSL